MSGNVLVGSRGWSSRAGRAIAVAAMIGSGLALTGCSQSHTGAAAVVDGDRIEVSTLNNKVDKLEQAFTRENFSLTGTAPRLDANQAELVQMIRNRVVDEAARRNHVDVTATRILEERRRLEARFGDPAALRSQLLQSGILPGDIDDAMRAAVLKSEIAQARGMDVNAAGSADELDAYLATVADSMDISVNPRYGSWDSSRLATVADEYPWLAAETDPESADAPTGA